MQETIQDRLKKLIADKKISTAEAERICGLAKDTLRKLLGNQDQSPSQKTLSALAHGFGVSEQWLLTGTDSVSPRPATDVRLASEVAIPNPFDLPKDLPVRGTAAGSHLKGAFQLTSDNIDYVRRPPALQGVKEAYALYVEGTSMVPQFHPGDLCYIHPRRPARPGDPVVVQSAYISDDEIEATLGIYLRQTEKHILVQKHNPPAEIQILRNGATKIHKVLTMNELFGV